MQLSWIEAESLLVLLHHIGRYSFRKKATYLNKSMSDYNSVSEEKNDTTLKENTES